MPFESWCHLVSLNTALILLYVAEWTDLMRLSITLHGIFILSFYVDFYAFRLPVWTAYLSSRFLFRSELVILRGLSIQMVSWYLPPLIENIYYLYWAWRKVPFCVVPYSACFTARDLFFLSMTFTAIYRCLLPALYLNRRYSPVFERRTWTLKKKKKTPPLNVTMMRQSQVP